MNKSSKKPKPKMNVIRRKYKEMEELKKYIDSLIRQYTSSVNNSIDVISKKSKKVVKETRQIVSNKEQLKDFEQFNSTLKEIVLELYDINYLQNEYYKLNKENATK